jgi:hypothetical protein
MAPGLSPSPRAMRVEVTGRIPFISYSIHIRRRNTQLEDSALKYRLKVVSDTCGDPLTRSRIYCSYSVIEPAAMKCELP